MVMHAAIMVVATRYYGVVHCLYSNVAAFMVMSTTIMVMSTTTMVSLLYAVIMMFYTTIMVLWTTIMVYTAVCCHMLSTMLSAVMWSLHCCLLSWSLTFALLFCGLYTAVIVIWTLNW